MAGSTNPARARVAVVVPCYGDGRYLPCLLGSLDEEEPLEIVVVDDGSEDAETLEALERAESRGITVVRHPENRGVSAARMSGLAASSAPYVFPIDADDLAIAGRLGEMADVLDREAAAAVCYGDFVEFGRHSLLRAVPRRIDPYRLAYVNEYPPAALFRRSVLEGLGGWRQVWEGIDARSDWSLWMTLAEHYATGIHLGPRRATYLYRVGAPRLAMAGRRHHKSIYAELRARHARLFDELREHRRASDMAAARKALYPLLYGWRSMRPWSAEPIVKRVLDRAGIWTLRHRLGEAEQAELEEMVAKIIAAAERRRERDES